MKREPVHITADLSESHRKKLHLKYYCVFGEFAQDRYYDVSLQCMNYSVTYDVKEFRSVIAYTRNRIEFGLIHECPYFKRFGTQCANPLCMDLHRPNPSTYLLTYMNEFDFKDDSTRHVFLAQMCAPNPRRLLPNCTMLASMAEQQVQV